VLSYPVGRKGKGVQVTGEWLAGYSLPHTFRFANDPVRYFPGTVLIGRLSGHTRPALQQLSSGTNVPDAEGAFYPAGSDALCR
jgi:hypothetical protein